MTYDEWLHDFYDMIAVPHTTKNARVGVAWCYTESGRQGAGRWNPLNTTWRLSSSQAPSGIASWGFNYVGVQNYASAVDGLYATKRTIEQNCCGFPRILKRLRSDWWTAMGKMRAIERSQWGTGGLLLLVYQDVKRDYWSRANVEVKGS